MRLKPHFSLRSLILATLTLAASVTLWRNYDPWRVERELLQFDQKVDSLEFSPDGKWAVVEMLNAGPDKVARYRCVLWNTQSGHFVDIFNEAWKGESQRPESNLPSLFSHDSKWLVANGSLGAHACFKIWNLHTQTEHIIPGLSAEKIGASVICPDGRTLNCIMQDESVQLFNLETGTRIAIIPDTVRRTRCSTLGDRLSVSHSDGTVRIVEPATGRELHRIAPPLDWEFGGVVEINKDILVVSARMTEYGWEGSNALDTLICYQLRGDLSHDFFPGEFLSASDDGALAAVKIEGQINIIDPRSRQVVSRIPSSTRDEHFLWLRNNTQMFDIYNGALYNTSTGRLVFQIPYNNFAIPSPDGSRLLAILYPDYSVALIDSATGDVLQTFPRQRTISRNLAAFSKDGQTFATQNQDSYAIIVYRRHRPEPLHGLAWLPEFWLLLTFASGLLWSILRDRRERKSALISGSQTLA